MFKVLTEGCEPKRATKYSAAVDLFAAEDKIIKAGETAKVRLGVKLEMEALKESFYENGIIQRHFLNDFFENFLKSHYLQLEPRSSLRAKGLIAGTGIIDLDYKDEIMIILHNPMTGKNDCDEATCICSPNATAYKINKGEKIAQIMLCEHKSYLLGYESDTERVGGFGHSGK